MKEETLQVELLLKLPHKNEEIAKNISIGTNVLAIFSLNLYFSP